MPWSLRKFLTKDNQQSSSNGGDKERVKPEKSSKLGKLRHLGKRSSDSDLLEQADAGKETDETSSNAAKGQTDSRDMSETNLETIPMDVGNTEANAVAKKIKGGQEPGDEASDTFPLFDPQFTEDCPNLTTYLEEAILQSAQSTLDRKGLKKQSEAEKVEKGDTEEPNAGLPVPDFSQATLPAPGPEPAAQRSPGSALCVEYVNYDMLTADAGSNGSSDFYSSDEEGEANGKNLNKNNNSNSQLDSPACQATAECIAASEFSDRPGAGVTTGDENTEGRSNHTAESKAGDRSNNDNERAEERNSSDAPERNGSSGIGGHSSEDARPTIDRDSSCKSEQGDGPRDYFASERNSGGDIRPPYTPQQDFMPHAENCPLHNGNGDIADAGYIADMDKARMLFGMCLCQNGEKVDNVSDLDFRNCNLKQVPHDIVQYAQTLTHLQLDSNTLSDLPKSLFSCENLEYLTVSDNDLGSLPPALAGLSSLRYLDISKNVIEDVPDCIRCCKSLNVLDASVNPIERLSEGFTQLVGLQELYLNDCFLEFLPASFGRLIQLTVLELRDNQLQILPKSIRRLTLLKRLDLGGNIFQEWPDVVCELRKLTELWLDGNELSRVPDELGELTSLVYLDLSRNFIEAIPTQIGSLTDLTDLLLCENHITSLPDTIGSLEKLTMLKVSMNQLTAVPDTIGKLCAVEELDLSHNKITDIPESIGNLQDMHTFLMDNNVLTAVPPELGRCRSLNVLQLSRNLLEQMPREIGDLIQLRVFNVCRNKLQHLPITVIKLSQLEALWVSSNQSKPNVPLHAELAPDGKTRILINILFPQTEQDTIKARLKIDEEGYANDAADDDEPPLFPKQRGITRVAFNLEPIRHDADEDDDATLTEDEDENMAVDVPLLPKDQNSNDIRLVNHDEDDHHHAHSVDVSADVISSNGNGLHIQTAGLMVKSPDVSNESIQDEPYTRDAVARPMSPPALVNGGPAHFQDGALVSNGDVHDDDIRDETLDGGVGNTAPSIEPPPSLVVPSPADTGAVSPSNENVESAAAQAQKIKQWTSHSHLPAIPVKDPADMLLPVAVEIMSKDDRSSLSSSPSSGPENAAEAAVEVRKPEPVRKLPIPSRAYLEQTSTSFGRDSVKSEADAASKVQPPPPPPVPAKGPSITDIPYMDGEASDTEDRAMEVLKTEPAKSKKGAKPPPPPRKDSLLSPTAKSTTSPPAEKVVLPKPLAAPGKSGYKVFTPALLQTRKPSGSEEQDRVHDPDLLALPGNKPASESSADGLASTDRDSGVGNDVDSQESIPECPDEHENLPSPSYRGQPNLPDTRETELPVPPPAKPQVVKSVATIRVGDVRPPAPPKPEQKIPAYAPVAPSTTQDQAPPPKPAKPPVPNKISASIKMFESITSPDHKPQAPAKSLSNLLPSGPRKTEEKAIIPPNNHLNGMSEKPGPDHTSTPESKPTVTSPPPVSPVKSNVTDARDVIMESQPNQVMFLRNDDDFADAFTFSKVGGGAQNETAAAQPQESPSKRRSRSNSKSKFDESVEAAKQNQFRERLEKIMQQQRDVSRATKAAQNGAAMSLARKHSFNAHQAADPAGFGKSSSQQSFTGPESPPVTSPDQETLTKKHNIRDRMKSKLERSQQPASSNAAAASKSTSAARLPRPRPGSAPAAQLLQRRGSSQRNSIAAPENGLDDRRLAPLCADDRAGLDAKSRSKSIEQQLGQLLLDSDEEHQNYLERINYAQKTNNDVIRRDHRSVKDQAGFRGSRSSLCSPPPVRHNMYAKARSSTNAAHVPLADWKHKLLQHIERKRIEKQQLGAIQGAGRTRVHQPQQQQSIGKIKSPPKTSTRHQGQREYYTERDGSNYVTLTQPQPRRDTHHRQLSKSITAPTLTAPVRTVTNTHQYNVEAGPVRSHFAGNPRAAKLAKQRTFTPGPESHGNLQPVAPRPKSAMDKFMTSSPPGPNYAEPPTYRQAPVHAKDHSQVPPTYEDHLHRRVAAPYQPQQESHRLVRADSSRRSQRVSNRGNYEDLAGYPLRHSGSHESLMDANRYDPRQPYFQNQPIRNASSHDSVLDQQPYQQQQQPQYVPPYYNQKPQPRNGGYPVAHATQRYPQATHNVMEAPKRSKYNDYATYVNIYDYEQPPMEYHSPPQMQNPPDLYRSQLGYTQRGSVRGDPRQQRSGHQYSKHDPAQNYKNYAHVSPVYQNPRQPPSYDQYRLRESISPTLYRPLAEREEGSVASAFRPYNQTQTIQPRTHHLHHHQHQQQSPYQHHPYMPPGNVVSPTEYKSHRPIPTAAMQHGRSGAMMSPPSNYQYMPEQPRLPASRPQDAWAEVPDDLEMVTVTVRRNPTFGFHVMGGVGAGGNPYRSSDDGVFVTHVTPGGAAESKLQAGDKILLVNGSDFVGISHKRAVDLLRNAGQVAVLVVERSLGKPV